MNKLIQAVMPPEFYKYQFSDIKDLIDKDSANNTPVFITTAPGFDPSS